MSTRSSYTVSSDSDFQVALLHNEKMETLEGLESEKCVYAGVCKPPGLCTGTCSEFLRASQRAATCALHFLWPFLRHLIPGFLRFSHAVNSPQHVSSATAFLDGMRGLAAFSVFLCHLSYGTWDIQHTYGSGKPGENNWVLQLPIVRLLYSGPPMVAMFFVISGYALSYKPVMLMREGLYEDLMASLNSSIFRRVFRLYLPCFTSTFIVVCIAQLGLYNRTASFAHNLRAFREPHLEGTDTFAEHFYGWLKSMFNFVNVFDWTPYAGSTHLDLHLWTIPTEYRCSLALFLTHLLTARMRPRTRQLILLILICWSLCWDRWDMFCFWSGHILAEVHHASIEAAFVHDAAEYRFTMAPVPRWRFILHVVSFLAGCFLASFPDLDAHEAPGYVRLNSLIPDFWTEKHRFWPSIGVVIIVWSTENIKCFNRLLSAVPIQYLGKISFSLYVMHGPVIKTFGYMTMEFVYTSIGVEDRQSLEVGFVIAALPTVLLVVWTADIFWRTIDVSCVQLTRWLERKVFY